MTGGGAGAGSRVVRGIVEGIETRDAGIGLDVGVSRGGGNSGEDSGCGSRCEGG